MSAGDEYGGPNVVERLRASGRLADALGRVLGHVDPERTCAIRCPNAEAHANGDRHASAIVKPRFGRVDCAGCDFGEGLLDLGVRYGFGATRADVAARLEEQYLSNEKQSPAHRNGSAAAPPPSSRETESVFPFVAEDIVAARGWTLEQRRGVRVLRAPVLDAQLHVCAVKIRGPRGADGKLLAYLEPAPDGRREAGLLGAETLVDLGPGALAGLFAGETDLLAFYAAARREGIVVHAVSPSNGEGQSLGSIAPALRGLKIAVVYDPDAAGRKGAAAAVAALRDVVASIVDVVLPFTPEQRDAGAKDVRDWLRLGGTVRDLLRLVDAAAGSRVSALGAWDAPIPFSTHDVPAFPVAALPETFASWTKSIAATAQVPPDLPGMLVLATVAACCAATAEFEGAPGWREPLNLYVIVALGPGNRKSAVFAEAVRPLLEFERLERERTADSRRLANSRHAAALRRIERAEKALADADEPQDRQAAERALEDAVAALRDAPAAPELRLVSDDATPERLTTLLAEQGGRMAVLSAEAALVGVVAGRYAKNGAPNLDVLLKGHSGDPLVTDRMGREMVRVERPALTLGLAVQPEVVREIVRIPGAVGRGLPQRFLFAVPRSCVGRREIRDDAVPAEIGAAYASSIRRLLERPVAAQAGGEVVLRLDAEASARFRQFRQEIERQIGAESSSAVLSEWLSKLPGEVGRIAAVLHIAEAAGRGQEPVNTIPRATIENAIRIGEFLVPHARAAFSVAGCDAGTENAKRLLAWIKQHATGTFSERDAFRAVGGLAFPEARDVRSALAVLAERNFVARAPEPPERSPRGGRPKSPIWVRSPHLSTEPTQPTEPSSDTGSVGSVGSVLAKRDARMEAGS